MIQVKTIILGFIIIMVSQSIFQSYMPECAKNNLNNTINYTLANFGHILYGRTIIGEILIPKNQQFCTVDDEKAFKNIQKEEMKKFVLIKRGTCKFTKKILNAQKLGADLVIIYDNQSTSSVNVVMANDGHGHLIDIPSIFISNSNGEKIKKAYQICANNVIMKISFDVYTSQVVNVIFWLDVDNRQSYITLRDFSRDYYKALKQYSYYNIRFKVNQNCAGWSCQTSCFFKRQYCIMTNKNIQGTPVQGKQLVYEQLRSYFLFEQMNKQKNIEKWFQYMNRFDQEMCMQKLGLKQCSQNIMKKYIDIDEITKKITETQRNVSLGLQNILYIFVENARRFDILFYPQASINLRNYYGLFRANDVFQMICQSLESPPNQCHGFKKDDPIHIEGNDEAKSMWTVVLMIIVVMMVLFFVALFVYNKLVRRQINQQMSMEVNKMVEQYVAMTEEKSKANFSMS